MAEVVVAMPVITHNVKEKSVVTVPCLICQNNAQCMVKNVLVVIRWATIANAVIQTSRTMLEDVETGCKGDTNVGVDDPVKIFRMFKNRIAIVTYMI